MRLLPVFFSFPIFYSSNCQVKKASKFIPVTSRVMMKQMQLASLSSGSAESHNRVVRLHPPRGTKTSQLPKILLHRVR